ncbi:MAG TPA: response regulator [Thermosynechococcaceae cyanobacterium]
MFSSAEKYILVVDDLADNLFLLKTVLESEGYVVGLAENGSTALAKVAETPPDLVLLDVMMPDMTGYEVARRLRQSERFASVPIVLITAYDEIGADLGEEVGADGFLRKPIDFDELLTSIKDYAA